MRRVRNGILMVVLLLAWIGFGFMARATIHRARQYPNFQNFWLPVEAGVGEVIDDILQGIGLSAPVIRSREIGP